MARKRQLTPSTAGSRVHTTRFRPLSPLLITHCRSRRRSSSVRCIAAHLRPAHKAMGDEGFATGTDSSCGWSSRESVGPGLDRVCWSFFSWAVFAEIITTLKLLNVFCSSNFYMRMHMSEVLHKSSRATIYGATTRNNYILKSYYGTPLRVPLPRTRLQR